MAGEGEVDISFDFGKALAALDVTYQVRSHLLGSAAGDHESLVHPQGYAVEVCSPISTNQPWDDSVGMEVK